jgi:hypothetical protein
LESSEMIEAAALPVLPLHWASLNARATGSGAGLETGSFTSGIPRWKLLM